MESDRDQGGGSLDAEKVGGGQLRGEYEVGEMVGWYGDSPHPPTRPVREGVSTDGRKFHAGPPCPTLIRPAGCKAVWGVARPQGKQPAAVFFPLGYPMPYGPAT
jgi:hypothetical protein